MDLIANFGGELAALGGALLWAVATVVYGRLGKQIPPLELNLVKGLLALTMLGLTIVLVGDSPAAATPLALLLLLSGGAVGVGLGDTAYFESLRHVGARQALLLGTLAPPMAALIALLFLGEMLAPLAWAGIGLTVAGVAWVVTERVPGRAEPPGSRLRGILAGLLAALAQAGGLVLSRAAFVHTDVSPLWAAVLRLVAAVAVLGLWLALARQPLGRWLADRPAGPLWGRLLFAIFFGTYLAIWLQQVSVQRTSAGVAQTLFATSPLFVLPLAAWSGERITLRAVLGALLALAGVGLLVGWG